MVLEYTCYINKSSTHSIPKQYALYFTGLLLKPFIHTLFFAGKGPFYDKIQVIQLELSVVLPSLDLVHLIHKHIVQRLAFLFLKYKAPFHNLVAVSIHPVNNNNTVILVTNLMRCFIVNYPFLRSFRFHQNRR